MSVTEEEAPQAPDAFISPLQDEAWKVLNASFHTPEREELRERGRALYQQDLRNRVSRLYARLDEQNARLDAILTERTERGGE